MEDLFKLDNVHAVALIGMTWMWMRFTKYRDDGFRATIKEISDADRKIATKAIDVMEDNTRMLGRNLEVMKRLLTLLDARGSAVKGASENSA